MTIGLLIMNDLKTIFMKLDKPYSINQEEISSFDYNKIWYMIPPETDDELIGSLYEGRVIDDDSDFKAQKHDHIKSRIRIADTVNICRELSEPIIFQVKIVKDASLELEEKRGYFWYASKVEILKSFSCWDLLPPVDAVFNGNIGIYHQTYIPEGLIFPKILNGNLCFWDCALPKIVTLPAVIVGSLEIIHSLIPHEWGDNYPLEIGNLRIFSTRLEKGTVLPKKIYGDIYFNGLTEFEEGVIMPESYLSVTAELIDFPDDFKLLNNELKTLIFEECTLPKNFEFPEVRYINMIFRERTIPVGIKLPEKYIGTLTFEASKIPLGLKLSEIFDGHLVFKNMTLPFDLKLPDQLSGILEFRNVHIPDGFELPLSIIGTLIISNSEVNGCLLLPSNDGYDFEVDKELNLSDFDIPDSVLPRLKRLPSWCFE
jgi:hypothetical protein